MPSEALPWHVFTSPLARWEVMPSFVVGEWTFIALALGALAHALHQGEERRKHLLVWIAAILAGTANDLFFMTLPLVENFWQAQASVMLTVRLPLYIPCVYVTFMYLPTVAAWRLGLPLWARAPLTGVLAIAFYAPYDIVGAKFLWWTWHDTDRPISQRLLGVPIGSTLWVILFTATFAALVGFFTDRDPRVSRKTFAVCLLTVMGLCTMLMMVQMVPVQFLDGGVPGVRGLATILVLYTAIGGWALRRANPAPTRATDTRLFAGMSAYFVIMVTCLALFRPETHRSESLHQTYGPCDVEATDIAGNVRKKFLCAEHFDEDFTFDCVKSLPDGGAHWYAVCGKPFADRSHYVIPVAILSALGCVVYALAFGVAGRKLGRKRAT